MLLKTSNSFHVRGAGVFPMSPEFVRVGPVGVPFLTPLVWLVANAAWQQPLARFLKVSLLHTLLLIQASS